MIPDYQRPYAWDEDLCQTLWDDIFAFAIPDNDAYKFSTNKEYFLGSIVTFEEFKLDLEQTKTAFYNYDFRNGRPITRSILALRMFSFEEQHLPESSTLFEVEHILPGIDRLMKKLLGM